MNCKACVNHDYLDKMAENFIKADRMASLDNVNPEITDSMKWVEIDKMKKLCDQHKQEFMDDYDI